jgi:Secretion system C-terminal sorting domain
MKKIFLITILILCYNLKAQCPATVTISGVYNAVYTGSNSWIASTGTTTIPTGSDVTLDANPITDGYVLLDVGFETQPNSTFLAIVQTPCSLLGVNINELDASLSIYPNPISSTLNIESASIIKSISISDVNGRIVFQIQNNSDAITINTDDFSAGIYFLKVDTNGGIINKKIIKN